MVDVAQNTASAEGATQALERTILVKPKETVNIPGVGFDALNVEIINGDVVLLNPTSGEKLIFPGMALLLFDPEDAPKIIINGQTITPEMFLAKIGLVGTATEEQYLSFSTLNVTDEELVQSPKEANEKIEELTKQLEEAQQKLEEMVTVQQDSESMLQVAMMSASQQTQDEENTEQESEPVKPRPPVSEGVPPTAAPVPASSSSSSSAAAASDAEEVGVSDTSGFFGFKTFLLQAALSETTEDVNSVPTKAVYGGGGSDDANFNPSNESQISAEVINYSGETQDLVIYADDPNIFTAATSARLVEISANLPDGFVISQGVISGLPAGFSIAGATLQPDGSYLITEADFTLNDRGDIQMALQYPVPGSNMFELTIAFTASYDPTSGVIAPAVTSQTYSVTHPVQVKDVSTSADLNYIGTDGREVWVLSNQPNANTILSGTGNDIIHGGIANDVISANSGNDLIYSSAGNDTIDGGGGSDTIDYSLIEDNITADLATLVGGYSSILVGATKTDSVVGVENIIAGIGNDTLIGNNDDNHLQGGMGNDILSGGLGNDILDGGDGTDSVSFVAGATTGMTLDLNLALTGATINVGTGNKTLISIENIVSTNFDDTIIGNTANNNLSGANGNDTFIANVGTNFYDGGFNGTDTGLNDLISYENATSGITVNLGGATNANGYVTLTAGAWSTDGIKGIEHITGSAQGDVITGDARDNILRGLAGNDQLNGADGNDTIYGGLGSDTMNGGNGVNILRFDDLLTGGVTLTLTTGTSGTAVNGGDTDTFSNFNTYFLTAQADTIYTSTGNDTISGLAGADIFYASGGTDVLDGGADLDTVDYSGLAGTTITTTLNSTSQTSFTVVLSGALTGSQTMTNIEGINGTAGNDTFINGSANQTINGNGGVNSLSYASSTTGITANMSALSGGFFDVTAGSELDRVANMQTLIGSSFADNITGNSSTNIFQGLAGADLFVGSAGSDTYDAGADIDTISYATTTGINHVSVNLSTNSAILTFNDSSTSNDVLNNFENVYATTGNDTVIGNSLDNIIRDSGGDDTFDGGAGVNTIEYLGITGTGVNINLLAGTVDDDLNGGTDDTISNFANATGSAQADTITGNNSVNTLNGDAGDDTLFGLGGNDILNGGDGNDILDGGAGTNTLSGGNGIDTASYSSVATAVTANLATGTATATGIVDTLTSIESFIGSAQGDTLTMATTTVNVNMGGGNDTINGVLGNPAATINGGSGIDTLSYSTVGGITGEFQNSQAVFSRGVNNDTVTNVEKFIFGSAADTISIDTNSIVNLFVANSGTVNGGGASDTIPIYTGTGSNLSTTDIDGDTIAGIFTNIEQLDFRSTSVSQGADQFSINSSQIMTMTGGGNNLTILINGTNLAFSDFAIGGTYNLTTNTATTHTYSFTDNPGVTLTVQVSA